VSTDRVIASQLAEELRRRCGQRGIVAVDPVPLSGGFSSELYGFTVQDPAGDLDGHLVLRLLEPGRRASQEQIILADVAAAGFPTAAPLFSGGADSAFGRPYTIMHRLDGGPAVDLSGFAAVRAFRDAPGLVADAMARLHDLDPQPLLADLNACAMGIDQLGVGEIFGEIEGTAEGNAVRAMEALRGCTPEHSASVVIHGDLHVLNLWRLPDNTVVTLDWEMATIGPPELDVARSSLMFSLVPGEMPRAVRAIARSFGRRADRSFRQQYALVRPLDSDSLPWYRALHALRLTTAVLTRPPDDPVAAQWRPVARQLTREIEAVTDVRLSHSSVRR
jgi:aminoglycoside phosphotransferase (APT) family kinase protein